MANITVFLQFSLVVRVIKLLIENIFFYVNNFLKCIQSISLIETFNVEMTETIIFFSLKFCWSLKYIFLFQLASF